MSAENIEQPHIRPMREGIQLDTLNEFFKIAPMHTPDGSPMIAVEEVMDMDRDADAVYHVNSEALRFKYADGSTIDIDCDYGDNGASLIYDAETRKPLCYAALTSDGLFDLHIANEDDKLGVDTILSVHQISKDRLDMLVAPSVDVLENEARPREGFSFMRQYLAGTAPDVDEPRIYSAPAAPPRARGLTAQAASLAPTGKTDPKGPDIFPHPARQRGAGR